MSREFVTVTADHVKQAENLLSHVNGGAAQALSRALNRAVHSARANAVRGVRDEYTAKAGDVRKSIRLKMSKPNDLQAEVNSSGSPLSLSSFDVKPKTVNGARRSPIRVGVRKGSAVKMGRAFVARVGGNLHVFERVGKARLPIEKKFGPSVPQMMGNPRLVEYIADRARKDIDKRLNHEIGRLIDGGRKR